MIAPVLAEFGRWRPLLDGLAGEIHPERWRLAGAGPEAAGKLSAHPRSRRLLSLRLDWLDGRAGAEAKAAWPDWSAWKDADPAALAPGKALWGAGLKLGAGLFRDEAAKLVLGREVAALKGEIGAEAYFFALRQAGLVRGLKSLPAAKARAESLAASVRKAARLALSLWLAALPESLAARVVLKLPPEIDSFREETKSVPAGEAAEWRGALARIISFGVKL